MRKKRKTVWAFLDGKKLVDVVQAALDNLTKVQEVCGFETTLQDEVDEAKN